MPLPIIIDTDMALDDWMAIAYLAQSPLVDIRAISIVATGEAHPKPGTRIAHGLLALLQAEHIPVAHGRSRPLRGNHSFPLLLRLMMDLHLGLSLPRPRQSRRHANAVQMMIDLLRAATEPLTIIALGPLTNLAELLLSAPELRERIAAIFIMGGALDVPGNIDAIQPAARNPHAEWNLFIDPYATDVVLRSGVPISLVPLDATNQLPLSAAFIDRSAAVQATPAGRYITRLLRRLWAISKSHPFYFWDPLTAVLLTHPHIAQWSQRAVRTVQTPGPEIGRLINDPSASPIRICTTVEPAAFEAILLATLNRPK